MITNLPRTKIQNFFLILMLGILSAVTPFSIDLYLPAFPHMAAELNTTIARVAFSVSTYFVGYAFGQLFYGPLLDRYGRKKPLYGGLILYIFTSLACMSAITIDELMLYRFAQALGGCVAGVASTAMVKDFFPEKEAAKIFSLLMLVLSTSPLFAPTVGSFIDAYWGWRATFLALAIMAFLVLTIIFFFLPDGHTGDSSFQINFSSITKNFKEIFREPKFFIYTFPGSFSFAGLFVYVAGSPGIFMDGFHVSPKIYSGIFAFLAVGMIGSGQLNLLFRKRFSSETIFKTALTVEVVVGALFLIAVWNEWCDLRMTIAFLFILLSCSGITYPNAAAIALSPFSKNVGSASALLGFLQLGIGSVVSGAIGFFEIKGTLPTAIVIFASASIGLAILKFSKIKNEIGHDENS